MSEYWKSTPKYWCKHCSTYVRDTKLEKANHEATPKHQGNLKRFLRDLHRGHEKDEKDKERAKNEVARLNCLVAGGGSSGGGDAGASLSSSYKPTPVAREPVPRPLATPSQRKQQLAQLAEMGVAIPDEFRPDMAMAGEWQVTSQKIVNEDEERKPDALAMGVRKRVLDEEEEVALEAKKRRWGSTYKAQPRDEEDMGDLDALLSNVTGKGKEVKKEDETKFKIEMKSSVEPKVEKGLEGDTVASAAEDLQEGEIIKNEPLDNKLDLETAAPVEPTDEPIDDGIAKMEAPAVPEVVFKKRKAKNIRQK